MRFLFTLVLLFLYITTFAQIKFEKGYVINNKGVRTECLIKNVEWKNNPTSIEYKINDSATVLTGDSSSVKEFGIYDNCKYINAKVKIDMSSNNIGKLTESKEPVWSEQNVFLRILIDSKTKLYFYEDKSVRRFFYSVNDSAIKQLVYKKYSINGSIAENYYFRTQLWIDVRCDKTDINKVNNLQYTRNDLMKYFSSYNECTGNTINNSVYKKNKNKFNIKFASGLNVSYITLSNSLTKSYDVDFGVKYGANFGIEIEYILPFNRNKWRMVLEPTFQHYKSEKNALYDYVRINLNSIEFPIGFRYYSFLSDDLKLFYNAFLVTNYSFFFNSGFFIDSRVNGKNLHTFELALSYSLALGSGVEWKKLSFEFRCYPQSHILSNYSSWNTDYSRFSFILGYKLFKR